MVDTSDAWDSDAILVVPGLPGQLSTPETDAPIYPSSALMFVKVLRSAGYPVRVAAPESVREVTHHAADIWLPVVNIGVGVLVGASGNLLADLLTHVFGALNHRKTRVHIRWNVEATDGSVHSFEFDGDSEAAVRAARAFEHSLRSDDDN